MEASSDSRRRIEGLPREDLVEMFLKLEMYSILTAAEKTAAVESCSQINLEKEKIKEKALTLLKRCRDLEGKQDEIEELKNQVHAYQSSGATLGTQSDGKVQPDAQSQLLIANWESRFKVLEDNYDLKATELAAAFEETLSYKNQGISI